MDVQLAHLNRDSFRDSFKGLVALEINIDLPVGFFPINKIIFINLALASCGCSWMYPRKSPSK